MSKKLLTVAVVILIFKQIVLLSPSTLQFKFILYEETCSASGTLRKNLSRIRNRQDTVCLAIQLDKFIPVFEESSLWENQDELHFANSDYSIFSTEF